MTEQNRDYYVVRAAVSRDLAHRAATPATAAIHTELATRYDQLAAKTEQTTIGANIIII